MSSQTNGVGTVGKALAVLDQVASFSRPVRFSELLDQSDYPKATLYRFLQTLTNQNMLVFDEEAGTYSLGMRLMRLAHAAWENASLAPIARPYVETLADNVAETIHLAQLDNGQVLFVDKLQTVDQFETLARVGKVAPAYCTGVGKAMLAFLPPQRLDRVLQQQAFYKYTENTLLNAEDLIKELDDIRKNGFAYDKEEHEYGINSIAAPILTNNGRLIGALSIASSTTRQTTTDLATFQKDLVDTAAKIGEEASSWQFPS